MAIISTIFHIFIFIIPLFLLGHNLLLYESWGLSLFSLPDWLCDTLTAIFILIGLFFLLRRLIVPQVRHYPHPMITWCWALPWRRFFPAFLPITSGLITRPSLPSICWSASLCSWSSRSPRSGTWSFSFL